MRTVGSSTASAGRASTFAGSHSVSEMRSASMPVTATMSPAAASGTATRVSPEKPSTWSTRPLRRSPSRSTMTTGALPLTVPRWIRPMPMAPT